MIYYSNQQACVIYLKSKNSVYIAIDGFIDTKTLKSIVIRTCELCNKVQAQSILLDTSKLEVLKAEDIDWIKDKMLLLFRTNKIKRIGFVRPKSVFGELAIDRLIPAVSEREYRKFNNLEEAEKWVYTDPCKVLVDKVNLN